MPERTLALLRHAKSDWSGHEADVDRPLAARGRRQAPEAGRWLAATLHPVDLAVVSPAARARSTWDLASAELDPRPRMLVDDRVYAASADQLLEVVRDLPEGTASVVMVGHNPGLEDLVELLTGEWVRMPTSGLAVVGITGAWSGAGSSRGVLRASGRPPSTPAGS